MEHHETVVEAVVGLDDAGQLDPELGLDIGRIDERIEREGIDDVAELLEFRNLAGDLGEVERLEETCLRVLFHTDGSTRVNKKYLPVHLVVIN